MAESKTPLSLSPVPTLKASEAIYQQIVDLIMSGELKPGDRLPSERALMEQLQRSRPTIREALRMLERSGLIKTIPGSNGAVVMKPSSMSVEQPLENLIAMSQISHEELLEFRELLEVASAEWAAKRRTEEDLQAMKQYTEIDTDKILEYDEFARWDLAFHKAVAKASHNSLSKIVDKVIHQLVSDILRDSYQKKDEEERKATVANVLRSHQLIYDAIEQGNPALAKERMTTHIGKFSHDMM